MTGGPNHVWASDGHDKLLPHGIAIYGFVDCWSRKILGLYAHVTNSDPRHVGIWYLELVKEFGGIPQKLTTDRGTETVHLAGYQLHLGRTFGNNPARDNRYHAYVPSTRNQKIEAFWSQMQDSLTAFFKVNVETRKYQIFSDQYPLVYDEEDPLMRYVYGNLPCYILFLLLT